LRTGSIPGALITGHPKVLVAPAYSQFVAPIAVEIAPTNRVRASEAFFNHPPRPQSAARLFVNHNRIPMPGLHRRQAPLAADAPHFDLSRRPFADLLLGPLAVRIPGEHMNPLAARRENVLLPVTIEIC